MVPMTRPTCPSCHAPIDRLQHSRGVVGAYPCGCWMAPDTARAIAATHRQRTTGSAR
jgi:hypothetical protein